MEDKKREFSKSYPKRGSQAQ